MHQSAGRKGMPFYVVGSSARSTRETTPLRRSDRQRSVTDRGTGSSRWVAVGEPHTLRQGTIRDGKHQAESIKEGQRGARRLCRCRQGLGVAM